MDFLKPFRIGKTLKKEQATRANDPFEVGATGGTLDASDYDPTLRYKARSIGVKKYRECEQDVRISALLDIRKAGVLQNRWSVLNGKNSPIAVKAADLCRDWLEQVNAYTTFRCLLDSTLYGYAVSELIWSETAGYWLPVEIRNKQPERFVFDNNFNLRLITTGSTYEGIPTQTGKFLLCRRDQKQDNPYGQPLGTTLWWLQWFRTHGLTFWARHADRFGSPWTILKYPPGANAADRKKAIEALRLLRRDTGIGIPENFALELLDAKSTATDLHERWLRYLDELAAIRILGSTLTTSTSGASGSRAAGEVHERVSASVIFDDAQRLETTINEQVFKWITQINFGTAVKPPRLCFDLPALSQQIQRAKRDTLLADLGYRPVEAKEYAHTHYGFDIDEDYYRRKVETTAETTSFAAASDLAARRQAAAKTLTTALTEADTVADQSANLALETALDEVQDASSEEDIQTALDEAISELPAELGEQLQQWLFQSDLAART